MLAVPVCTHREHEEGVKHESHGGEGLQGCHHVPLQAQREDDEQRHGDQQQRTETEVHLLTKKCQDNFMCFENV